MPLERMEVEVRDEDVNLVLSEEPLFAWRVRCAALERMVRERDKRIEELEDDKR